MNERIRQLAKEAAREMNETGTYSEPKFQEKFAELIIQECMACSSWVGKINTNSVEPVHTAHAINQRIKQHFGVEE